MRRESERASSAVITMFLPPMTVTRVEAEAEAEAEAEPEPGPARRPLRRRLG
jgi:hypothetical protein